MQSPPSAWWRRDLEANKQYSMEAVEDDDVNFSFHGTVLLCLPCIPDRDHVFLTGVMYSWQVLCMAGHLEIGSWYEMQP